MYKECTIIPEVWTILNFEVTRGRFRKLQAVFESFFEYKVWGIKRCGLKNV